MKGLQSSYIHFFITLGKRVQTDRVLYAASALTYTTLLSLVPLMTVLLAILSAFPVFKNLDTQIQAFIFNNFVPASGEVIQHYFAEFTAQTKQFSGVGFLFLVVVALLMIRTIEGALNDIWGVEHNRRGISAWLRYWAILTLAPVFLSVSMAVTSYVLSSSLVVGVADSLGVKSVLLSSTPFILSMLALTLLYVVLPNTDVPWLHGLVGAFFATLFFELAKQGFLLYVLHFPTYRLIYGALAVIPLFLLWIYLSWVIILFGALITNVLTLHRSISTNHGL